jgi:hypothetical protein
LLDYKFYLNETLRREDLWDWKVAFMRPSRNSVLLL